MKPLSNDLRERIVSAVDHHNGSRRPIAKRSLVNVSTITRLLPLRRQTDTIAPPTPQVVNPPEYRIPESQVDRMLDRISLILVLLCCGALVGIGYYDVHNGSYVSRDTYLYYYPSILMKQGKTPYTEFCYVHPPGLLLITVVLDRLGLGLVAQSHVFWTLGVGLAAAVALMPRAFGIRGWTAALVGFLAMISSELLFRIAPRIIPHLLSTFLVLGALVLLWSEKWLNLVASAVLLVLAAFFRIQSLAIVPGLIVANWVLFGWRRGTLRNLVFVGLVVVLQVGVTIGLEKLYPGYFQGVYVIQMTRRSASLLTRLFVLQDLFNKPGWLLGLLAALLTLTRPERSVRSLGLVALVTTVVTVFAGRSLLDHCFIMVLPLFAVCLAVLAGQYAATIPVRWPILSIALAVAGLQFYHTTTEIHALMRRHPENVRRFDEIRQIPEKIVLATDPRYSVHSGKQLLDDFYAVDAYIPFVMGWFDKWLERVYPRIEAVVVDGELVNMIGDRGCDLLLRGGKPIYCFSDDDRRSWENRVAKARGITQSQSHAR